MQGFDDEKLIFIIVYLNKIYKLNMHFQENTINSIQVDTIL